MIWFPPGEKHWHGATAATAMTHIAIQERLDGKTADWMGKVSDEQYRGLIETQAVSDQRSTFSPKQEVSRSSPWLMADR